MKKLIVGISGASGAIYGIRLLQVLSEVSDIHTILIVSNAAKQTIRLETGWQIKDVEALADEADIVLTGRIADASLVTGPCIHEFGWRFDQLDRIANATVAGHLIECGAQLTAGLFSGWVGSAGPRQVFSGAAEETMP